MRAIGLGLVAEGSTDYRFFRPLIRRCVLALCQLEGQEVEIGEPLSIEPRSGDSGLDFTTRVKDALLSAAGGLDIVFLHADAGGDSDRVRAKVLEPLRLAISGDPILTSRKTVRIVPVREMEAWPLVDGESLRRVLGVKISDEELGIPSRPQLVEKIQDPKKLLRQIAERARGGKARRRQGISLEQLGEFVALERLIPVPAFGEFYSELESALREVGVLKVK